MVRWSLASLACLTLLIAGCIVEDQITTLTIRSDGSADLVEFRSNTHSNQKGLKGQQELAEYKQKFNERVGAPFDRINKAGGTIETAVWIREEAPFASVIRAKLPNAKALEAYLSELADSDDDEIRIKGSFESEGQSRTLRIRIAIKVERDGSPEMAPSYAEGRQATADSISEFRFAVQKGKITESNGFTVAKDKQSGILDLLAVMNDLADDAKADIFLTWDVP